MFTPVSMKDYKAEDPSLLVYGEPKIGKTKLTLTLPVAEDGILYLGVDPGHLILRGSEVRRVPRPKGMDWNQGTLDKFYEWLMAHATQYRWVVIDGIDDIGRKVLNAARKQHANQLKAYDDMNTFLDTWIKAMRDITGLGKLFITHISEEKDDLGKRSFGPALPGKKFKEEIDGVFDIILCMRMIKDEENGKFIRILQATRDADPAYLVGDRTGVLDPIEPPDIGHIVRKLQENYPELKEISEDKIMLASISAISKINRTAFDKVKEFLKTNNVDSPKKLNPAKLKEAFAMMKEVIQ